MNGDRLSRPVATVLGAAGVHVPGAACALLDSVLTAGIRSLVKSTQNIPPPRALLELAAAIRAAAVEYESQRHRDLAIARLSLGSGEISLLLSPAPAPLPLQENEIGTEAAAEYLEISVQRIRQLASTGRIRARRGPHDVWILEDVSVREYRRNRRPRGDGGSGRDKDSEPRREAG